MKKNELIRLDNAALIYSSTMSGNYAYKFRVSVDLDEPVDRNTLNTALATVIRRFPSFRYKLQKGLCWWYFRPIEQLPAVSPACPLDPLPFNEPGGYQFKVSASDRTISLDVFHSVADGTGAMTFLLTLASEYLYLHDGIETTQGKWLLNPRDEARPEEYEDAFDSFPSSTGKLEKGAPAYHVGGSVERESVLNNMKIDICTEDLISQARAHSCTVTDLLTAAMIRSLQRIRTEDRRSFKRREIKISIPVNLRKIYGINTMRNFSSYVNVGIDASGGIKPISEIVSAVSSQKKALLDISCMESKIGANVSLENNAFIDKVPWFIKRIVMKIIHKQKGDKLCSQTLSNLGVIELPEQMRRHVRRIDFQLGRSLGNFGSCGCVSFGGVTTLNFSRRIKETWFENYFMDELASMGISFA